MTTLNTSGICYTVHHAGGETQVHVNRDLSNAEWDADARAQAVLKGVDGGTITGASLGWAVDMTRDPETDAKIATWQEQTRALGLKTLTISMDDFDPDAPVVQALGVDNVREILLVNTGGRFTLIELPATATMGDAAQAIDQTMTEAGWGDSAFLEVMEVKGLVRTTGVLAIHVFIGS